MASAGDSTASGPIDSSRPHVGLAERADARPAQVVEMRAAPKRPPEVVRQHAHVGARRALDHGPVHARALRVGRRVEAVDGHRPRACAPPPRPRGPARAAGAPRPSPRRPSGAPARSPPSTQRRRPATSAGPTPRMSKVAVTSPDASSVDVAVPRTMSVVYVLGSTVRKRIRRVTRPRPTSNTPVASGSRVPAWPTRRCPKMPPAARHDVVRGPAGRLVDDHQAVDAHVAGGSALRSCVGVGASCSPRSSSSTLVPAAIAGSAWKRSSGSASSSSASRSVAAGVLAAPPALRPSARPATPDRPPPSACRAPPRPRSR